MGIKSIWDNDFYNKPPLPKWSFIVDFGSFVKDSSYAPTLQKAIVSCQWGKRETSIVKTYYAGVEANFPGRVQNTGELNITFNENEDMQISRILDELFNGECSNDRYFTGKGNYTYNKTFNKTGRTITLIAIKPDTKTEVNAEHAENEAAVVNKAGSVSFHNCILTSIDEVEFSYDSTDETVQRVARISYDYMFDNRTTKSDEANKK